MLEISLATWDLSFQLGFLLLLCPFTKDFSNASSLRHTAERVLEA